MRYVLIAVAIALFGIAARAESNINFNYEKGEDITTVINDYAKATRTKWVIDPQVRGRITLINHEKISLDEAFNQLAAAMAINGLAYTEDNGTYRVGQARQIQRSDIPVVKEVPPLKPERMMTWIVTLKHVSSDEVMRQVRTLSSKDGEMASMSETNQMMFSDYTSSLNKIAKVIEALDQPVDAERAKIVASAKRNWEKKEERKARMKSQNESAPEKR